MTPLFHYYKNMTDSWVKVPDGHMDQWVKTNVSLWVNSLQPVCYQPCCVLVSVSAPDPLSPFRYNQVNAISLACRSGLEECQALATQWFRDWMETNTNRWVVSHTRSSRSTVHCAEPSFFRIHPNLRSTIYCNAIAAGGAEEWQFAWSEFKKATIAIEADKLRSALACTKQPWLLNRCHTEPPMTADAMM